MFVQINKTWIGSPLRLSLIIVLYAGLYFHGCAIFKPEKAKYNYDQMDATTERLHKKVERFLEMCIVEGEPVKLSPYTRIDSLIVDEAHDHFDVYFNRFFAFIPFRETNIKAIYEAVKNELGWWDNNFTVTMYATNQRIEELIPNFYRSDHDKWDYTRLAKRKEAYPPLVCNLNRPWQPEKGLAGRNIALWPSHGWYYEPRLDRWEWQRARLFQSVEDLGPMSFTLPYILPMLENAGACTFLPRERDTQVNEVIVDNDSYMEGNPAYTEHIFSGSDQWRKGPEAGFAIGFPPYGNWINPFRQGTYRVIRSVTEKSAAISWIPDIPEDGKYAVYISYTHSDSSVSDAHYSVYHSGGRTDFLVNQTMGGHTWIYLGEFIFRQGRNPERGAVVLSNQSREPGKTVSADAVRFGGGMGNIIRGDQISGRPRYMEGARYYLQYAGMPDTLVYTPSGNKNDYTDDYRSRGEWVNYLIGAPYGPNKDRMMKGLGIPVDASLAFHTDAGIAKHDTVIGTLAIYSTFDADSMLVFPDSVSRFANRDFADILQTQIVDDIRATHDPVWRRRGLWDRDYSEAFRPNIPAVLLELLSHQNFLDMQYFQDPQFRFDVSRSIYKAILKFVTTQQRTDYVVQPLPVTHFSAVLKDGNSILLRWQPVEDPLEPSAKAEKFIVYTKTGENGFDNGQLTDKAELIISDFLADTIYSFKVTAVNAGGESFPSEVLSVCRKKAANEVVLIINGFDRVSAPAAVQTDVFSGFANFIDAGVADGYNLDFTGRQFNFDPQSKWTDDDAPGFGSSYADMETKIIPGNTHNFSYTHGKALKDIGYSFVSVSDEAVMSGMIDLKEYTYVDLILGEEQKTLRPKNVKTVWFKTFPDSLQKKITEYCRTGGSIFISGANVGSDMFETNPLDSSDMRFSSDILHYRFRTDKASLLGVVHATDSLFKSVIPFFKFNTDFKKNIYRAEAVDGVEPSTRSDTRVLLRYSENNISAAVGFTGSYKVVVFGFPFETIEDSKVRSMVMQAIFAIFNSP